MHCKEIGLEKDKLQLKKEMLLRQGKYRCVEDFILNNGWAGYGIGFGVKE